MADAKVSPANSLNPEENPQHFGTAQNDQESTSKPEATRPGSTVPSVAGDSLTNDSSGWREASLNVDLSISEAEEEADSTWSISGPSRVATVDHRRSPSVANDLNERHVQFHALSTDKVRPSPRPPRREIKKQESVSSINKKASFKSTCFKDGVRQIDFILAYTVESEKNVKLREVAVRKALYRLRFEALLRSRGLQLECESANESMDGKTAFIKVHAPFTVLQRQAELQRMRKPFMECDIVNKTSSWWTRFGGILFSKDPFSLQEEYQLPEIDYFTDAFERDRKKEFLNHNDEWAFFTSAQRAYLTWDIISNATVRLEDEDKSIFTLHMFSPAFGDRRRERSQRGAQGEEEERNVSRSRYVIPEDEIIESEESENEESEKEGEEADSESEEIEEEEENTQGKRASFRFLLSMSVYTAGFPLHDGEIGDDEELNDKRPSEWPLRKYLYESWARPRQWRRYQPLGAIREYYGEKMALYFAFIGFYTKMLIAPSVVGLFVTIYGLVSITFDENTKAICENSQVGDTVLCPDCPPPACSYTKIKNFCTASRIATTFDSAVTVFFSVFMAMWAVCFLEYWRRYSSELSVAWDTANDDCDEENVRPEYLLCVPHMRLNPITMRPEPHLRMSSKLKRIAGSVATVLFFVLLVLAFLAGTVVYKRLGPALWQKWLSAYGIDEGKDSEYNLIVSVTSAVANGLFIMILSPVYTKVAWFLTQAEFPRTDREFETSYTYKVFVFQCVNFYSFLFWLAIIKGRDSHPPHMRDYDMPCPVSGCLVDVTIQLAVIFTGKQVVTSFLEFGKPVLLAFWKKRSWWRKKSQTDGTEKPKSAPSRWQRDFHLVHNERVLLFSDYLELLIQYGFVTMFVAAFPLAPLFAFLNNVFEIRLDAYKTLVLTQRSVPFRSKNLGAWFRLLTVITRVSVLTNALVIAFTTQFVDRLVYRFMDGGDWESEHNVTNPHAARLFFTLSIFRTSDWTTAPGKNDSSGQSQLGTGDQCYYVDYRYSPDDDAEPYQHTLVWWHVLAAKLVFVILFEHFVMLFQSLVAYLIPGIPKRIKLRIAREKYLLRVNFLRREFGDKAKDNADGSESQDDDKPFVPDELPDWTDGNASGRPSQPGDAEGGLKVRRGKILQKKSRRKRRPFLLMLFKKLMLCD